jgi:glutathione synthase/RimK-type ligase-like ATP-grasp enzyme
MILVWGVPRDPPVGAVLDALKRCGREAFFFDQHETLDTELHLCVDQTLTGTLTSPRWQVDLSDVTGAFIRPYDSRRLFDDDNLASTGLNRAAELDNALFCWAEMTAARVVNRPSAMASNLSKPYQAELIRVQGFHVPETLITTDAVSAEEFWRQYGDIVYKSISGVRSVVTRVTPEHRERFKDLAHCPTQFQRWIPGVDYRVHVCGNDIFPCEVLSPAVDYRYPHSDEDRPTIRRCRLPAEVAEKCRNLVRSLSLDLAGIDLRLTPSGSWYCFEVNASPGFTFFEELSGTLISDSIARLLMRVDDG